MLFFYFFPKQDQALAQHSILARIIRLQQHSIGDFFETLDVCGQIGKRELKNTVWKDRTLIVEILQITEKWRSFCLNTFHNVTMILSNFISQSLFDKGSHQLEKIFYETVS